MSVGGREEIQMFICQNTVKKIICITVKINCWVLDHNFIAFLVKARWVTFNNIFLEISNSSLELVLRGSVIGPLLVPVFTYIHKNSCKSQLGSVPDFFPPLVIIAIIKTALPNMDREAKEEYFVVIQAKDMGGHMGGLSGTTTVTITLTDVNDNPPKFAQSKYHNVCVISYIRK